MRKLIIHIDADISDANAMEIIQGVIERGRISATATRKHYCHVTTLDFGGRAFSVQASQSKAGTDTFKLWEIK